MSTAWNIQIFEGCLSYAVNDAQVGFYFEEGGCWGMAVALYEMLTARGVSAELRYRPEGFVHAWVHVSPWDLDHNGASEAEREFVRLPSVEDLVQIASEFGVCAEQVEADRAQAEAIIQNALEAACFDS